MPAPFALLPLTLPPDAVEIVAGDVDDDGLDEIIVASAEGAGAGPRAVTLTVIHVSADGRIEGRDEVELGTRPALWDVNGGLWVVDGRGLAKVGAGGEEIRVAELPTPLSGLGPTTPARWDLAADSDGDGVVEVLVPSGGGWVIVDADGQRLGELPSRARGRLGGEGRAGGQALTVGRELSPVVTADVDGDGREERLIVEGRSVAVYSATGQPLGRWTLPVDPERDDDKDAEPRREVTDVKWEDVDGDGRLDLLLHRTVVGQSWFGSTAELVLCLGEDGGLGEPQVVATDAGSYAVWPIDTDGDGDLDVVLPQVDLGFSSLARGLLSRSLTVPLTRYAVAGGQLAERPEPLFEVKVDLESPELPWNLHGDITRDGRPDLVLLEDEALVIRPGLGGGFDEPALRSRRVHPVEELLVWDVTGDGWPEVVAWAPGAAQGTLVIHQPE